MVQPTMNRHKRTGLWQSILLVFLFALAAFIIFQSPWFEVKEIEARGNRQVGEEEIIASSGLHTGVNIFKVNLKESRSNLSVLPVFKDVRIEREFPGRIIINVSERTPVALLPDKNGFIKIDREQVYIQKSQELIKDLPVITGIDIVASGPGDIVNGEGLESASQVLRELPDELIRRLSEVHYQDDGSFILYTMEGDQCRLGSPVDIQSKGKIFLQLLDELEGNHKQIEYVDLSFMGSPVVKYKE